MGPEYMEHLVRTSLDEVSRLLHDVTEAHGKRDYEGLEQAAHDLKAVSGSIGMQQTQLLAEAVERSCIFKNHATLPEEIKRLAAAVQAEKAALA